MDQQLVYLTGVGGRMKSIVSGVAGFFLLVSCSYAGSPDRELPEVVDRLPNIVEFRILDDSSVYLRTAADRSLDRFSPDGGWVSDHHYIDGETGEIKERPDARAPNEIVLTVGWISREGGENYSTDLQLKEIRVDRAVFLLTTLGRDNKQRKSLIAVRPYEDDTATAVFRQTFELSRTQNKGLTLLVQGQTIAGLVTSYSDEVVEMRSQQFERIVVRIDRIDGIAYQ